MISNDASPLDNLTDSKGNSYSIYDIIKREEARYDEEEMQKMINGESSPMAHRFKKSIPE